VSRTTVRAVAALTGSTTLALTMVACDETSPNLLYQSSNEVWVMQADGSDKTKLASPGSSPQWIPGTKDTVAFLRYQSGKAAIHTMDNEGKNITQLTPYDTGDVFSWSPDRNWIAFESDRDGDWEIYKMKADGSSVIQLTFNSVRDGDPDWGPKGVDKIAFWSDTGAANDIMIVDADGQNLRNLTEGPATFSSNSPMWSPDGDHIAFLGFYAGWGGFSAYTTDLSTPAVWGPLTSSAGALGPLTWTPSGDYILYVGEHGGGDALYKESFGANPPTSEVLSTFDMGFGVMAASEVNVFYSKQTAPNSSGLYAHKWRVGGETLLAPDASYPDY
jgi:Tol biopolymer transport system component